MYLGQCVERVSSKELFVNPMHPYTQALLSAIPIPDLSMRGKPRQILKGEVKSPIEPPAGLHQGVPMPRMNAGREILALRKWSRAIMWHAGCMNSRSSTVR